MQAAMRAEAGAVVKRPLFRPAPPPPAPSESILDRRLAEELEFIRRRLDMIGGVLSNDPILLTRHVATLQDIDLIKQTLGHLAKVIGAEDKDAVTDAISLGELKSRLKRKAMVSIAS